jgi:CubicO group peptidase (beta-lactamase class C family)
MRFATLLLAISIAAATLAQDPRGNPSIALDGQSIDVMIASFMREHDVAGLSLAIVQAPYITRASGFGLADKERRTLVSVNTMFDVGAMKNAYTAVAIMQLVEEKKLTLEAVQPLLDDPAQYAKLETLIADKSGESYTAFVRRRQFAPLGLKHTFFGSELSGVRRESLQPGDRHRAFLQDPVLIDPTEPATGSDAAAPSASAIYSSAHDVSIWDIALAGGILIQDPALRRALYDPAGSGPWFFPGHQGLMIVTGSGAGFSSLLSRFTHRDELLCVTLLANRGGVDLTQLARNIAGAYNAKLGPPRRAKGMRVQQSPFDVGESLARLQRALQARGLSAEAASGWEEGGEIWIAASDPKDAKSRRAIDEALLDAIGIAH